MLQFVRLNFNFLFAVLFFHNTLFAVTSGDRINQERAYSYQEILAKNFVDDWHATYENQKLPDGRAQTLNKKGANTAILDRLSKEFSQLKDGDLLEIGGGYGDVLLSLVEGNQNFSGTYTLNDLDARHLYIAAKRLEQSIAKKKTPKQAEKSVNFMCGNILSMALPLEKYDAILIARVLHFFTPTEIRKTLKSVYKACKPGGRVYVVAITPYVNRFKSFILEYESRVKASDEFEFPGFVLSLMPYVNREVTTQKEIKNLHQGSFTFFGPEIGTIFKNYGFKIIKIMTAPLEYPSKTWQLDGRENMLLIAEKPEK